MDRRNYPGDFPTADMIEGLEAVRRWTRRVLGGMGPWVVLLVVLLVWFATGFYVVGPGERGVVLLFGGVVDQTAPGLRYRLPWPAQAHYVVDVAQVRRAEIGFRTTDSREREAAPAGSRTVPAEALMLTGDENIVSLELFVQYRVQDPVKYLFRVYDPEGVLRTTAEVALRNAVGQNTIDYTMTEGRSEIQDRVRATLQGMLDRYDSGLQVTDARLLGVDPPDEVRDAFHDVVRALEDRDRLRNEAEGYREDVVPKARGEAAQMVEEARAYEAQRVIRARGDAERFLDVLGEYRKAKTITRDRLYLESIERFLPGVEKFILDAGDKQGALPLLPLRSLSASPAPEAPGAAQAQRGGR